MGSGRCLGPGKVRQRFVNKKSVRKIGVFGNENGFLQLTVFFGLVN